jgi:hypothetical protein
MRAILIGEDVPAGFSDRAAFPDNRMVISRPRRQGDRLPGAKL